MEPPSIVPNQAGDVDVTFTVVEKPTGAINFGTSVGGGTGGLSGFIGFEVGEPLRLNRAPSVSARIGVAIRGRRTQLNGFVEDDGLPASERGVLTLWTVIDGPGEVKWLDAELVRTTATFSAPGSYLLALNADDGEFLVGHVIAVEVE